MTDPVLVVDFDDVLVEFCRGFYAWHNKVHGTRITYEGAWTFEIDKLLKIDPSLKNQRVMDFWLSPEHAKIEQCADAFAAMVTLREHYAIHMATARPQSIKQQTDYLIQRYYPDIFETVSYLGFYHDAPDKRRTKDQICDELGATAFIDDAFHNVTTCVKEGRTVIMPDRPWNQGKEHSKVLRTYGWSDILTALL